MGSTTPQARLSSLATWTNQRVRELGRLIGHWSLVSVRKATAGFGGGAIAELWIQV